MDVTPEKNDASVMLRLPADLKHALQREAFANGRRITSEINMRLTASLKSDGYGGGGPGLLPPPATRPTTRAEASADGGLSATEQALLAAVRKLWPEKQLALLSLLR